jgi:hypothetical protein
MLVVAIRKVVSKCSSVRRVPVPYLCFSPDGTRAHKCMYTTPKYGGHEQSAFSYSLIFFLRYICWNKRQGLESCRTYPFTRSQK